MFGRPLSHALVYRALINAGDPTSSKVGSPPMTDLAAALALSLKPDLMTTPRGFGSGVTALHVTDCSLISRTHPRTMFAASRVNWENGN